jgi:hypothetical protein
MGQQMAQLHIGKMAARILSPAVSLLAAYIAAD